MGRQLYKAIAVHIFLQGDNMKTVPKLKANIIYDETGEAMEKIIKDVYINILLPRYSKEIDRPEGSTIQLKDGKMGGY